MNCSGFPFKLLVGLHDLIIYDCNLKKKKNNISCISVAWITKYQEESINHIETTAFMLIRVLKCLFISKWFSFVHVLQPVQRVHTWVLITRTKLILENELFSLQSHWSQNLKVNFCLVHFSLCYLLIFIFFPSQVEYYFCCNDKI